METCTGIKPAGTVNVVCANASYFMDNNMYIHNLEMLLG